MVNILMEEKSERRKTLLPLKGLGRMIKLIY